jgi:hypothetical protein
MYNEGDNIHSICTMYKKCIKTADNLYKMNIIYPQRMNEPPAVVL